jgi:hypothetical protein
MGIIPAAALGVVAIYAGDALLTPPPAAPAAVLAVLTVIGLHILGNSTRAQGRHDGPGAWLRRGRLTRPPASALAVLPRLPQRMPQTRALRPAAEPAVAAYLLMRGPPDSQPRRRSTSTGNLPR